MFLKYLISGCLVLIPIGCVVSDNAVPHLKIVWLGAAAASDEMPRQAVAPETYAKYPVIVVS
jgi:hypothetical protein